MSKREAFIIPKTLSYSEAYRDCSFLSPAGYRIYIDVPENELYINQVVVLEPTDNNVRGNDESNPVRYWRIVKDE